MVSRNRFKRMRSSIRRGGLSRFLVLPKKMADPGRTEAPSPAGDPTLFVPMLLPRQIPMGPAGGKGSSAVNRPVHTSPLPGVDGALPANPDSAAGVALHDVENVFRGSVLPLHLVQGPASPARDRS